MEKSDTSNDDNIKPQRLKTLDKEIGKGLASLEAGQGLSGKSVYEELVARRSHPRI